MDGSPDTWSLCGGSGSWGVIAGGTESPDTWVPFMLGAQMPGFNPNLG